MRESIWDSKLPRKLKKRLLGKRLTATKIKQLISKLTISEDGEILPYPFCPKCGCVGLSGTGNMAEYPEHWEHFYCVRCRNVVGNIDNSRFYHALECKENNYDPRF